MLAWALVILTLTGGELRWQAPPGRCPSAEAVQAQIDAAGGLGDLELDAVVTADSSGEWTLELTIVLDGFSDTRTLRDEECGALAEAAVLLVATRLDLERTEAPSPPEESSAPLETLPQEPPPALEAPEPKATEPAPTEFQPQLSERPDPPAFALPTGLFVTGSAGLSLGSVPIPGVSSELALGHAWPNLRASLRGRVHVATPRGLAEGSNIRIVLGTAGPQVCARPAWRRLEFPLCAEVGVGASRAVTRGSARDRGGAWVEAGLGGGVAWFVDPRWALTAHLAGASPLVGSRYALGDEELWDPSPVAGRVMLGVEFFVPIQIRSRPEKSQ